MYCLSIKYLDVLYDETFYSKHHISQIPKFNLWGTTYLSEVAIIFFKNANYLSPH